MRSLSIPSFVTETLDIKNKKNKGTDIIKQSYQNLLKDKESSIDVSIIIPAYNEEKNILEVLFSLTQNRSSKSIEIIVVDNNSTDNTNTLVKATGVRCIEEKIQSITAARNAGLANARGNYILNADADSIYPPDWVEQMVNPLINNNKIAVVYGRYSFIPDANISRISYFLYETIGDIKKWVEGIIKDEAIKVFGCNSGYRRDQGIEVEGYNHPPGTNEDGWLALKLRNHNFGKLHYVSSSTVWTSDRRLNFDKGVIKVIITRIQQFFSKKPTQQRIDL
jgi:glycosyltransferase involved in cell wall biosynthesis